MKKILIIVSTIMIFIVCYILLCQPIDYWKQINLNNSHLYKNIIKNYGRNYTVEKDEEMKTMSFVYNGIKFTGKNNINGAIYNVEITDSKYDFGIYKIKVGDNIDKVKILYNSLWFYFDALEGEGVITYIQGDTWIEYHYENNIIIKIIIFMC